MPKTNAVGWPLWTMTYTVGGEESTTQFFQPDLAAAEAYATKWTADYTMQGDGTCEWVAVAAA